MKKCKVVKELNQHPEMVGAPVKTYDGKTVIPLELGTEFRVSILPAVVAI